MGDKGLVNLNRDYSASIINNHIAHILVGLKIWENHKIFGVGINNFRYHSYDKQYILKDEHFDKNKNHQRILIIFMCKF